MPVIRTRTSNSRPVRPVERAGGQRGQTLVIFALFLVVLVGASALTIDYATWLKARRDYQNAADAAALAGAPFLARPIGSPLTDPKWQQARDAAWASLQSQLGLSATFSTSGKPNTATAAPLTDSGYRMWVSTPPVNAGLNPRYPGASTGASDRTVFVWVEKDNPSYFSNIFGQGSRVVSAWATAGTLPNRWAVLGLCPQGDPSCDFAQDVKIAGSTGRVTILDGDLGSNWGLTTSGQLVLPGGSGAWLIDPTCSPSTFRCPPELDVNDGGSPAVAKAVNQLPVPVPDPNYARPPWLTISMAVPDRFDYSSDAGSALNSSTALVSCDPSSPRLGPGSYDTIEVKAGGCLVLDPTYGLTTGQQPGIFYVKSQMKTGNGAFIIGDGVSVFFAPTATGGSNGFTTGTGGGIVLNNGNAGQPSWEKGGWTADGLTPWSGPYGSTPPAYDPSTSGTGIAFYVVPSANGTSKTFNMSGAAGLAFKGILYGPKDLLNIGGNGAQGAFGQIVGWTIRYNGTTEVTQTYAGPSDERAYLLEPKIGQ